MMAVSTNIGLCEFRTAEQGISKDDKNSTNFRITVTKKFYEKLKRVGGSEYGPFNTDINVS